MLETFTADTFEPHVRDPFWIRVGERTVETRLVTVRRWGTAGSGERGRDPFALLFVGPGRFVLPQGTYPIEHESIGGFELFIVPLGPDGEGMQYEAIFT